MMFTDEVLDCVGVQSEWRKRNQLATETRHSQTTALCYTESGVQAGGDTMETSNQTEAAETLPPPPQDASLAGQQEVLLRAFLHGVQDMVLRALAQNSKSHAFDGFTAQWEEEHGHMVSCLHRLLHPGAQEKALHVTSVTWNSTGSVVACSYGRMDDGDWTSERSYVCTWNLDRGKVNAQRADLTIDVHTVVTALSFHPTLPNVIAGGLYSGEVLVWDTSRTQDPLVAQSGMSAQSHREPVYEVQWVCRPGSREQAVLSGSSGGRVLLWRMETEQRRLCLSEGYALVMEQVPHCSHAHSRAPGSTAVGVTALALSPWDPDSFLVGSEGGLLLKCSFSAQRPAAVSSHDHQEDAMTLRAPAVFSFRPCGSPVHSIHYSPFHRNLFICGGTDGLVHVHSVLQSNPLMSLRVSESYVFQVSWSPSRPTVFAAATGQGAVQLFDLGRRCDRPVATIEVGGPGGPGGPLASCLAFNPRDPRLLAVGCSHGALHVWSLSTELTEQQPSDTIRLEQLAAEVAE